MKIDRALQLQLLQGLSASYPRQNTRPLTDWGDEDAVAANLAYLRDHGLVVTNLASTLSHDGWTYGGATITAKGLDFLADDGGLGAILGVVTIRLHADTLRELIEARVMASDLAPADKSRLIDSLRALPGESIKHLTMKTLDWALTQGPAALEWLATTLKDLARA